MGDCSDFLYNLAFLLDETFRPSVNHGWFNVAFFGLRLEVEQVSSICSRMTFSRHIAALAGSSSESTFTQPILAKLLESLSTFSLEKLNGEGLSQCCCCGFFVANVGNT